MELFANTAATTLNGAINNSVTSLTVTSATGFPSTTGQFRIIIDSEILLVTAVSGTTFTVTRGAESTTAASHISGAAVTHILTAGSLGQFKIDANVRGTFASLPAAGPGGQYHTTDSYFTMIDDASNQHYSGLTYDLLPPSEGSFSFLDNNSGTITTTSGASVLYMPTNGATDHVRGRVKSLPTAPYTITMGCLPVCRVDTGAINVPILFLRESSSGKMMLITFGQTGGLGQTRFRTFNCTSSTSLSVRNTYSMGFLSPTWMRFVNDGTNITSWVGCSPFDFIQIDTQLEAAPFTTAADQYGYALDSFGQEGKVVVFHLKES